MTAVAERTDSWAIQFMRQAPGAPWIEHLRRRAFEQFSARGFPTVHEEDWRYTNVAPIAKTKFEPASAAPADPDCLVPFAKGVRFVFVNGRLVEFPASLPKGIVGITADDVLEHVGEYAAFDTNAFVALNTAFLSDIACVRINRGAVIDQPIHIVYVTLADTAPVACHPRTVIVIGDRARCSVVETHVGQGTYLNNPVTELAVKAGASVDHYKLQMEPATAFHVATLQAELERGARYSTTSISLGACLARSNSNVRLGEAAEAILNGLYLVNGTQHADNQLTVDHAQPNASSHELYKGVLDGKATAAFNGKILVRKNAQKTEAKQTNKNLLLSDDAVINTKPELQILADDVRCTHGATIGQLDPEAAFYLQSRGVGKEDARSMLTYAFAQDVIDRIKLPFLRDALERIIFEKLYGSRH
jgi:Fe-S cluster assembly protein SufD